MSLPMKIYWSLLPAWLVVMFHPEWFIMDLLLWTAVIGIIGYLALDAEFGRRKDR